MTRREFVGGAALAAAGVGRAAAVGGPEPTKPPVKRRKWYERFKKAAGIPAKDIGRKRSKGSDPSVYVLLYMLDFDAADVVDYAAS